MTKEAIAQAWREGNTIAKIRVIFGIPDRFSYDDVMRLVTASLGLR